MSQQHTIQQRSAAVNGFDNHKTEREFSSQYHNSVMQPARFNSGNSHNKGTSHSDYENTRTDNVHYTTINNRPWEGLASINRSGGHGRPLQDRFVFVTACLIGQHVDVQVKNGSIFSGIFHSTNIDKDYGVVLKMARLVKDGSTKGGKFDAASKAPIKKMIIWANDLVQVIAKDVPLMGDELANGYARGNRHEILTDSLLSHSHHLDLGRELEPWTPEKDAPESLGLEDTFQNSRNRNWDQFETNKTLFGVESTFDEELYTTKLEKGPQTKDLEREAARIAREIEGRSTRNIHLAEERGTWFSEEGNSLDEESMYSSVLRKMDDDIGEDNEDEDTDNHNDETFGVDSDYTGVAPPIRTDKKGNTREETCQPSAAGSLEADISPSHNGVSGTSWISPTASNQGESNKNCRKSVESNLQDKEMWSGGQLRENDQKSVSEALENKAKVLDSASKIIVNGHKSPSMDAQVAFVSKEEKSTSIRVPIRNIPLVEGAFAPSPSDLPIPTVLSGPIAACSIHTGSEGKRHFVDISQTKASTDSLGVLPIDSKAQIPLGSSGSLSSLAADPPATNPISNASVSSPSSSIGSISSEKSTLNPHAKEFRLNPNAKSFTPSYSSIRPSSPGTQGTLYMPSIPPLGHMQGPPVGFGTGSLTQQQKQPAKFGPYYNPYAASGVTATPYLQPVSNFSPNMPSNNILSSFPSQSAVRIPTGQQVGQSLSVQSIMYNSQAPPLQSASAYTQQNGQLYPQQMMFGQHGQAVYIPQFPQEMMQGPPLPQGLIPSFATSQQGQQTKHCGTTV